MNKDDLLFLLGKMPTKAELAFKVIEEVDCGKFILKKIDYSAEAGEIIPAFLLFFHIHNWQCLAIIKASPTDWQGNGHQERTNDVILLDGTKDI
ncbi:MAG: hypothetical protein AB4206_15195 [Xenococcaceae cyanobacterium]